VYRIIWFFFLTTLSLFGEVHIKKGVLESQREEILQDWQKEEKGGLLSLQSVSHIEFLKKILEIKEKGKLTLTILTRKTKRNLEGIEFLKKNQVELIFSPPSQRIPLLSCFILESRKSVWLNIESLFRKTSYSKIPFEMIWVHDETFYNESYQEFREKQKESIL